MKYLLYIALWIVAVACAPKQHEQTAGSSLSSLTFSLDSLIQEECVGGDCAKLRLVWPVASGSGISSNINFTLEKEVTQMMMFGEAASTLRDTLVAGYFQSYREFKNEFPDAFGAWEIDVEGKVTYRSDSTLSISLDWMNYLGGAHPNSGQRFLNFNGETGKLLSRDELVKDEMKLLALAEKKFREFHEVAPNVSLEEDGRFFLAETGFFLPNSMGFENEKFKLIYIPYEIGPYAMGYTELEFTRDELGELLRW